MSGTAGVPTRRPGSTEPEPAAGLVAVAWRLAWAWRRQLAALAAAAAVVAATIAGALGVGDSLSRGLERLALSRLGGIAAAVVGDEPFSAALADAFDPAPVPALVVAVTVEATGDDRRAVPATLLAADGLDRLGFAAAPAPVPPGSVVLNAPLARSLGVGAGGVVVLRTVVPADVPADLPLGRRDATSAGRRLRVAEVLPEEGLGQFALRPTQATAGLAIVGLGAAQDLVGRPGSVNLLLAPAPRDADGERALVARLRTAVRPALADLGLEVTTGTGAAVPRLTSRRLVIPGEADRAAQRVLGPHGGRPSLAFLAVSLTAPADAAGPAASVPYSTVLGIDSADLPVGGLVDESGSPIAVPDDDGIVLTRWAADDLAAQGHPLAVGAPILLRCFLPETLHGVVEETTVTLRLAGIAAMAGPAVARDLVPEVRGVTDEASIADWDPPFPFDRSRIRATPPDDIDDRFWKLHGAAPKGFVSLATARRLAASRFGRTTAWHLPATAAAALPALEAELAAAIDPTALGFRVEPLRADALAAARGSTPFGGLFLALSMFVVGAGLILEWLLFSLLVASHRRDIGLLAALGWPPRRVTALVALGALPAALVGSAVGTLVGPVWTRILLAWLGRAWEGSVAVGSTPLFAAAAGVGPATLLAALAASTLLSAGALVLAARAAARRDPLGLLRGGDQPPSAGGAAAWLLPAALAAIGAGIGLAWWARSADASRAVGLFFAAGILCLVGMLALVRAWLGRLAAGRGRGLSSLGQLAGRGLAHGPGRAFAVAAMVAVAEFLVVAVSAFRLGDPAVADRSGPTGGWAALATFGNPTAVDPSAPATRDTLGLDAAEADALAGCEVALLRSSAGDDASCTNLYASVRPVVHGVGPGFIARGGFRFSAVAEPVANPWTLLERSVPGEPLPAILDAATAQWALKLGGVGATFSLPDATGNPVMLRIVGLLDPGILQGAVIVSERTFSALFPRASGYAMALAAPRPGVDGRAFEDALATAWADAAVTIEPAATRLRRLQAVQNTFLAGFQSLGFLGLLLGTLGVAAVQVQGVIERSAAFGLLGALGFGRGRIGTLVVTETLIMVGLGLVAGGLAGVVALPREVAGGASRTPLGWILLTSLATLLVAAVAGWAAARRAGGVTPRTALADG
ncbi:MAG: FtsX-like permease family protein [Planctomycetota bacterium]